MSLRRLSACWVLVLAAVFAAEQSAAQSPTEPPTAAALESARRTAATAEEPLKRDVNAILDAAASALQRDSAHDRDGQPGRG
jgi:hypothetical protein